MAEAFKSSASELPGSIASNTTLSTQSKEQVEGDRQLPGWWALLSPSAVEARQAAVHKAVDMFFFVHQLPFALIGSRLFIDMVRKIQECPAYVPCHRTTLAGSHLSARSEEAHEYWATHLNSSLSSGLMITSDGWKNSRRQTYHNYLLSTATAPVFVGLKDVTGMGGSAVAIHDEVKEVLESLEEPVRQRVILGCTDTPSTNRAAWKLLRESYPGMCWIGCMAHELNLLFKDWASKIEDIKSLHILCKRIAIWIRNHGELMKLYTSMVVAQWEDKRKHTIQPYLPGDTRMMTTFLLVHRTQQLKPVFKSLVNDARYRKLAQSLIAAYNKTAAADKRVQKQSDGLFVDEIYDCIEDPSFWKRVDTFIEYARGAVYLHRLVDTHQPVLGKVYYSCAMVEKCLRTLALQPSDYPIAPQMLASVASAHSRCRLRCRPLLCNA